MDPAVLALLIPLAPFMLGALVIWTRHRRKEMELQAQLAAEKAAQYAQHTRQIEERLRVIERIVTDRGFDVSTQIEALRDREGDGLPAAEPDHHEIN